MTLTPAMQQYYDLKNQYPDSILFFRMGDFYEMFDEDAKIANKVLAIAITTRNKNADTPIPLAGIPYHAKEKYLPLLIEAGYKVAIAEQVSDPKLKWIVQREVVRVITPATIWLEGENYEQTTHSSTMLAYSTDGKRYGMSRIDMQDRSWKCSEYEQKSDFLSALYTAAPSEIILEQGREDILHEEIFKNIWGIISYHTFTQDPYTLLTEQFGTKNLEGFGIEQKILAQRASAVIMSYITHTQQSQIDFLSDLQYETPSQFMGLDASTIRSLDLVYNLATQSSTQWTLFWALNRTKTPMGKHYLREQILHPLQDIASIQERQNMLEAFIKDTILLDKIRTQLAYISNIDALLSRLSLHRATPRDLLSLKNSLIAIREIIHIIESSDNTCLKKIFTKT